MSRDRRATLLALTNAVEAELIGYHEKRSGYFNGPFSQPQNREECSGRWCGLFPPFFIFMVLFLKGFFRNDDLTTEKIEIVKNGRNELDKIRVEICESKEDIINDKSEEFVAKIEIIMDKIKKENQRANQKYNKVHTTYDENIKIGQNPYSAWWNKTTFQSLLSKTVEKCYDILNNFRKKVLNIGQENVSVEGQSSHPSAP
jgi:hypothetical protein